MRYSGPSIVSVVCGILLLAVLWRQPETPAVSNAAVGTKPVRATSAAIPVAAKTPTADSTETAAVVQMEVPGSFLPDSETGVEAMLAAPIPDITFEQTPLRDVLTKLTELTGIGMVFDPEEVGDTIDPDVPVDIHAAANSMTFETLLSDFILAPNDLVFIVRDQFLVIMSYDKSLATPESMKIAVYDCRDLIPSAESSDELRTLLSDRLTEMAKDGQGTTALNRGFPAPSVADQRFMMVIATTVAPGSWFIAGRFLQHPDSDWYDLYGSINCVNGLLVIRHTRKVHKEVRELLRKLRERKR